MIQKISLWSGELKGQPSNAILTCAQSVFDHRAMNWQVTMFKFQITTWKKGTGEGKMVNTPRIGQALWK